MMGVAMGVMMGVMMGVQRCASMCMHVHAGSSQHIHIPVVFPPQMHVLQPANHHLYVVW